MSEKMEDEKEGPSAKTKKKMMMPRRRKSVPSSFVSFFFFVFFLILFRLFVVVSFHPSRPGRRVMESREWIESRWGCVNEVTRDVSLSLSLISLPPWPTCYTIGQKALSFFNLGFFPIESPRL
jgi:hypothetical protein